MSADIIARGLAKQAASSADLAASGPAKGAALVGFRVAAAAASPRTAQDKLRDITSVKDFGATGNGSSDDTAAIQAAINATIGTSGGALYFPNGTYRLTDKLVIPYAQGWRIFGQSREGTVLLQTGANKRILSLESDLTHGWEISEMSFQWSANQPATATQAVAVFLGTGTATTGGFFNWQVRRCRFVNGFRGIAGDAANSAPLWGCVIRDCVYHGEMSGAMVFAVPSPAVGQPNILIEACTITVTTSTEPVIAIGQGDNITLRSLEFLGGAAPNKLIDLNQCQATLQGCKTEAYAAGAASANALFSFVQSQVTAIGCSTNGMTGSGGNPRFMQGDSTTQLSVIGLNCSDQMTAGVPVAYVSGKLGLVSGVRLSGRFTDALRQTMGNVAVPTFNADKRQMDAITEVGDAAAVLTAASDRFQCVSVALTANRSITLPSTGCYDGMEFEIVRRINTASGAFSLTVTDPLSGQNFVFPPSSKGFARYRSVNGTAWRLVGAALHATDTGWTAGTGTPAKGAFAAYAGTTVAASYTQAAIQTLDNAARDASQRVLALENALRGAGLISA